jgi:hypothetical protein
MGRSPLFVDDAKDPFRPQRNEKAGSLMAGRVLNRRELRKQADQATASATAVADPIDAAAAPKKAAKRKASATPKVKKPRKAKAPLRMQAMWCVYDGGMKEIALFDYKQRAAAEEKLAALRGKQKGLYFMQIVKHPMPAVEPAELPAVV